MKKTCSILLILVLLFACITPAHAAQIPSVSPLWENTSQAYLSFTILESGESSFTVTIIGNSSAILISTVTYLEQKVGSSWVRVDIGTTNNELLYRTTNSYVRKNYTHTFTERGEYRAVCDVTVYGTAENETFTLTNTCDY